jgi:hypothetical protein
MKRLILFHVLLQGPVVRVPMAGENNEWVRIIGIMQVINLTGMVFQEGAGSRILGGAEQSVSETGNARGRCRILTENGYCAHLMKVSP